MIWSLLGLTIYAAYGWRNSVERITSDAETFQRLAAPYCHSNTSCALNHLAGTDELLLPPDQGSSSNDEENEEEVDYMGLPFVDDDDVVDFGELILDCSSSGEGIATSMSGIFGRRLSASKVDVDARAEDYDASVAEDV